MDYLLINKLITKPIYRQIVDSIKGAIASQRLKDTDRLPSERELCSIFSISATVVKKAYDVLIEEGLIIRIKGKGTFVTHRDHQRFSLKNIHELDREGIFNQTVFTRKVLLLDQIKYETQAYRILDLNEGEWCYSLLFLIETNNNPLFFQKVLLPKKYYPKFNKLYDSSQSILSNIEKIGHLEVDHFQCLFSVINFNEYESALLMVANDSSGHLIRQKVIDKANRSIAYLQSYFPGQYVEMELTHNE